MTAETDRISIWVNAYLADRRISGLARTTLLFYDDKLTRMAAGLDDPPASQVSAPELRAWLNHLQDERTPGGVHAHWRACRAFWRWWAEETGQPSPVARIKLPPPRLPVLPAANIDAIQAMLAVLKPGSHWAIRDRAIILTLLDTGLRASELTALEVDDWQDGGVLVVRHGKGGKRRQVYAGERTRRAIRAWLRERGQTPGPLFLRRGGGRLDYDGLREIIQRHARTAGVDPPPLHSFRRAFALACKRAGIDLVSLQRLMGHADMATLLRYLPLDDDDDREAHQRASPADRWRL